MCSKLFWFIFCLRECNSFIAPRLTSNIVREGSSKIYSNNNAFDVSKPTFDLYTLRNIRGDALLRYNNLNQSEPLRINLYLLLSFSSFSYTAVSEAVVGEPATLTGTVASTLLGLFGVYRFVRECGRRSSKLNRIEKELNAQALSMRLPTNQFADRPYESNAVKLGRVLRSNRRVLAICGTSSQLQEALQTVRILRRRLKQASVIIVAVPTDASSVNNWAEGGRELRSVLAETSDTKEWLDYFQSLGGNESGENDNNQLSWFGLTYSGKSFGSGSGSPPRLLEMLGQTLLPVEPLDEDDENESCSSSKEEMSNNAILMAQKQFYDALTSGDESGMTKVFSTNNSPEVNEVLEGGGRIDMWDKCLEDGARPSGMKISGSDVLLVSETEAYSTVIEFPADTDSTLLAVQKWNRATFDDEWKLQLHQTIPWSPDSKAAGTLRCDYRGCTALTRGPDRRWNFRGMID